MEDQSLLNVKDQGVFSMLGRRKAQEDSFVLHEYHEAQLGNLLLAGVFDGHGGNAASTVVSKFLPEELLTSYSDQESEQKSNDLEKALEESWKSLCDSYRSGCDGNKESCIAYYDEIEGIIEAGTGSRDLVAGTTATVALVPFENASELIVLNCGDSRTLLCGNPKAKPSFLSKPSLVQFSTRDHSPKDKSEQMRLKEGKRSGLKYSTPECSMSRWWLQVGDYQYAVTRSLEGRFATSKGIVSEPDIYRVCLKGARSELDSPTIVLASDGLFEVIDNESVAKIVLNYRNDNVSASDIAKILCSEAVRKGSSDNVSAVVIFLDPHDTITEK